MMKEQYLEFWLIVWMIPIGIIFYQQWKKRVFGVGLVFAYLIHLWLIHWTGAFVHALPSYTTSGYFATVIGFRQSVYGVIAFTIGNLFIAPLFAKFSDPPKYSIGHFVPHPKLPFSYIGIGLVFFFILTPLVTRIPTVSALASVATLLIIVGFCLNCWKIWLEGKRTILKWWILMAMGLPFLTMVMHGFLGYGVLQLLMVLAFVASFFRPRWKILLAGLLIGYLGLSFYVTYMRDRSEIRKAVWGRQPLVTRIERVYKTISTLEWFSVNNPVHLDRINSRLNQNYLVGSAINYMSSGYKDYAYGETIWQAVIALVPRALWPEKSVFAGSGHMVGDYTGIVFAEGTAVGVGHVMEFYINFGTWGVVLGFMIVGIILRFLDSWANWCLLRGDWQGFTLRYLPSLAFLQVEGSLVELTATAGAGFITAFLANKFLSHQMLRSAKRTNNNSIVDSSQGSSFPISQKSVKHYRNNA